MTFLESLNNLHEGQRLEFKESQRGLPADLWETYSAFANSEGGEIVLGVAESKAGDFEIVGVVDAVELQKEFWATVRNPQKVERDVMMPDGVQVTDLDGKQVVIIAVPRAERTDKPVQVYDKRSKSMIAYVRRGENDVKCTSDELRLFSYDAISNADRRPLEEFSLTALCSETITAYRNALKAHNPAHPWNEEGEEDLLFHLGAIAKGRDDLFHPTLAGLLVFGQEYEITRYLPQYFLDYREELSEDVRWSDRLFSASGDWSGNLFDFYRRVITKIDLVLKAPFALARDSASHTAASPVKDAVHEAVANALIHAYYGMQSTVRIIVSENEILVTDSGPFVVDQNVAIAGGFSESRNPTIMRIFNMIGVSDHAGSGLCTIFKVWREHFGSAPHIEQAHSPLEVRLKLPLLERVSQAPMKGRNSVDDQEIILLCSKNGSVTAGELSELLGVSLRAVHNHLAKLEDQGVLTHKVDGRKHRYYLASKI